MAEPKNSQQAPTHTQVGNAVWSNTVPRTLSQIRDFLVSIGEAATEAVDGLHA